MVSGLQWKIPDDQTLAVIFLKEETPILGWSEALARTTI
jgi:hypothetical protein